MSETIEIEYKSLLSMEAYQNLLTIYANQDTVFFTQTNVYFDTPDFQLKHLNMGLRIRLLQTKSELTLKSPLQEQVGLLETTDELTLDQGLALVAEGRIVPDQEVAKKLEHFGIKLEELVIHGQLKTKRLEIQIEPTILLVLDESWYHGQHDYELEMEVTDSLKGLDFFQHFLAAHHIDFLPTENKIRRTLRAKASI